MESKKINQLATNLAPLSTDLTIVGDPITGVSKKITLSQIANLFAGSIDFYANLAAFPATGTINIIYCAKDTQKLYLWSGSAYVEVFPSQAVLNTYQLLSAKGVANGYASLDSGGKVPIAQLPSSIMEYKGLWSAATNTPTLANGTGDTGDVYICNAAGSVNFGAGAITFAVGDYVIYSGSIWQRSSGAVGTVTSVGLSSATSGVTIGSSPVTTSGTITLAIATATTSQNGLLSSTDWATFNAKQNTITLTTTGTSGASTLVGATLNIPNYGSALTGYVPYTGATQDVDLDTFKLNAQSIHAKGTGGLGHIGLKHQSASATASANEVSLFADSLGNLSWLNGNLYLSKFIISSNTAARSYTFPNANGTVALTSDLTGYLTAVTATSPLSSSGGTTPNITIAQATTSANGYLSSTDWNTFNGKQNALTLTTTGTSGAATLIGATLNIPNYNSMVYPSAGIALSTGTAWGTSITDNSANWNTAYTNRITSATAPLSIISNVIAMSEASGSVDGYLSRFDWTTFNNKQSTITLTTTGTSGAATFTSNTLNIPNYGSALSGYLPLTGGILTGNLNISINTSGDINYLALNDSSWTSGDRKSIGWYQGGTKLTSIDTYCEAIGSIGLRFSTYSSGYIQDVLTLASTGAATFSSTGRFIGALTIGTDFAQLLPISASNYQLLVGSYYDGTNLIATATSGSRTVYNIGGMDFRTFTGATVGGIVTDISRFSIIASTGAAAFTGSVTVQGGLIFDTSQVISSSGVIGFNSTQGLFIYTKTGSSYDFKIYNGVGSTFMQVPTGTQNVEFLGAATFSSSVTALYTSVSSGASGGYALFNYGANVVSRSWQIASDGYNYGDFAINQSTTQTGSTYATKFIINAAGNVGIGTVSPTHNLEIKNASGSVYQKMNADFGIAYIGMETFDDTFRFVTAQSTPIQFYTNNTLQFAIAAAGAATFSSTVSATSYNRFAAGTGFLNGKYGVFESVSTTGPIYCIGDSYVPTSTSLNTMYGIGYSYNQFTGKFGPTDTWGMYVAANGSAGVFLAGGGAGYFAGAVTATGFFESSDKRIKTLIQDNYQTKGIASITPKLYTKNGKVELGYYAQDFVGILDSAISKIDDGMLNLSYREVHTAKIYALEERIKELEFKLN